MYTKTFTNGILQTDVEPHMRLHGSLMVKLFKKKKTKIPFPVEPSPEHQRAVPDPQNPHQCAWVSGWAWV
jgi:hypothetical protein